MLWDITNGFKTGMPQPVKLFDPDKIKNDLVYGFSPDNRQLVISDTAYENVQGRSKIIDLSTIADGKSVEQATWADFSTLIRGFPVGSPAGNWFVQGTLDTGIGMGATLPWYASSFTWMPWNSTLDGRGFLIWAGGGGGGGGIGSYKVDYAVDLLKVHSDTVGKQLPLIPLRGHESAVTDLLISPDEQWILTMPSDSNEQLRLWNIPQMQQNPNTHPVLLPRLSASVISMGFTADSRSLVIVTSDNMVHFWSTQLDDLISQACQTVSRNLIINEWERYFPGQKYRQTCPNLPVHPSAEGISTDSGQ
jgi:WD40 repeat protein